MLFKRLPSARPAIMKLCWVVISQGSLFPVSVYIPYCSITNGSFYFVFHTGQKETSHYLGINQLSAVWSHLIWGDVFLCEAPSHSPDATYQISRLSLWPARASRPSSPPLIDALDGNARVQGEMKLVQLKVSSGERQKITQERSWRKKSKKENFRFAFWVWLLHLCG